MSEHQPSVMVPGTTTPVEILVNDTDYASCDDGSTVELLCMDYAWLDTKSPHDGYSTAGGFSWSWPTDESREHSHATCLVGAEPVPGDADEATYEAHAKRVTEGVAKMLREKGYQVGFY